MNDIIVSVICLAYNHEKYIRNALDGFINQRTTFKYEVWVHDDASIDKTAMIIKEYEEKYPDIIHGIYQKENQYSKGVKIVSTYIHPHLKGKYIAICEGDDVWVATNKLQRQYDALETNPECAISTHYVEWYDVQKKSTVSLMPQEFYSIKEGVLDRNIQLKITLSGMFHLNSAFLREEIYDQYINHCPKFAQIFSVGDICLYLYFFSKGRMYFIPDVMSRYNKGTDGSWTQRIQRNRELLIKHKEKCLEGFKEYKNFLIASEVLEGIEYVDYTIDKTYFDICCLKYNFKEVINKKNKKFFKQLPIKLRLKLYIGLILPNLIKKYDLKKEAKTNINKVK